MRFRKTKYNGYGCPIFEILSCFCLRFLGTPCICKIFSDTGKFPVNSRNIMMMIWICSSSSVLLRQNIIMKMGFNLHPTTLENVLDQHPSIEAAVVSICSHWLLLSMIIIVHGFTQILILFGGNSVFFSSQLQKFRFIRYERINWTQLFIFSLSNLLNTHLWVTLLRNGAERSR